MIPITEELNPLYNPSTPSDANVFLLRGFISYMPATVFVNALDVEQTSELPLPSLCCILGIDG